MLIDPSSPRDDCAPPTPFVLCPSRDTHERLTDCWMCWCDAHREAAGRCLRYAPGHNMHWIHANFVGRTPWGWRDGTVVTIDGSTLSIRYLFVDRTVRGWHHSSLADVLGPGSPVRVHEQYHSVGGPFGWINVEVIDGLGPVPAPEDPSVWAAEVVVPITDLATGMALPVDHTPETEGPTS